MESTEAVIARLEALIEVTRQGYSEMKEELKALREDFRSGQREHGERIFQVERELNKIIGGLTLVRVIAGGSFLGAIVSTIVAIILAVS